MQAEKLIILATRASVCVAVVLLLAKVYAWYATGSMGVLASLVDSLLDLLASIVNLFAVRYALLPADEEHRFGHGKAEALAGLGQATFIAGSAIFLLVYTVERLLHPSEIAELEVGASVIILSIALTFALVCLQNYVVKKTGSVAIKADSLHYRSDLLTNAGILLGLLLFYFGVAQADPVIALAIGLYIFKCAIEIGYESIQLLLDRELPEEDKQAIAAVAVDHPDVIEIHDIRTRQSGRTKFVQLHLVLDGNMSLLRAHDVSQAVEDKLRASFVGLEVIIHQDPHTEKVGQSGDPLKVSPLNPHKTPSSAH